MKMLIIALLSLAVTLTSAWQIHHPEEVVTHPPVDKCANVQCNKKIPPHMTCARMYVPEGECCPICACIDTDGASHKADTTFKITKYGQCWYCMCSANQKGHKEAACYQRWCPPANCPKFLREKTSDGCCDSCPNKRPTFPPRPNKRTFPPRPNRRTFPPRG